jgi:hypothetical protein
MSHLPVHIKKKTAKVIHSGVCTWAGDIKVGFEVGFVHTRAVKSKFMCVCTKVRLLVSVCW